MDSEWEGSISQYRFPLFDNVVVYYQVVYGTSEQKKKCRSAQR